MPTILAEKKIVFSQPSKDIKYRKTNLTIARLTQAGLVSQLMYTLNVQQKKTE